VYVVFGSFDQMTGAVQFIVLKRADKWVVKSGDLERVFLAKRDAVAAAIRFANDSGKEGKPSVVLFQKSKADFQSIWMYGQSPYPPTSATSKPRKLAHTLSLRSRNRYWPIGPLIWENKNEATKKKVGRVAARRPQFRCHDDCTHDLFLSGGIQRLDVR
jgi:hypothetical protein